MINNSFDFDDLNRFWQFAMQDSKARRKDSRNDFDLKNMGGLTWEQAKQLAISGWHDGMIEIENYRAKILPFITEKVLRPRQIYAMAGYSVDVGSFLANEPECFIAKEYEERNYPGRIYKIVCSISFSWSIKPETIIQRGAMVCALIDAIEYSGNRAEVICNDSSCVGKNEEYRQGKHKEKGWLEFSVTVKKPSQALEMSDLAFCLAHPSMLRRIMFSAAELVGWSDFADGYGYPAEATEKGDIFIKEIFSGEVPDEQAIEWVLQQLQQLGINIESK